MSILGVIGKVRPDEIYNLAAQSHVQVSFDSPEFTADVDAVGVLRILEAVRQLGMAATCRIYQASTSELYGKVEEVPQNEQTPFHPFSPYAVAKQYGYWMVREYREAYGMFACNGILFNHESPRRGENFVTRKITLAATRISQGLQSHLELGNLSSRRDWGYARDYVECMWLILQQDTPGDFVIALRQAALHQAGAARERRYVQDQEVALLSRAPAAGQDPSLDIGTHRCDPVSRGDLLHGRLGDPASGGVVLMVRQDHHVGVTDTGAGIFGDPGPNGVGDDEDEDDEGRAHGHRHEGGGTAA